MTAPVDEEELVILTLNRCESILVSFILISFVSHVPRYAAVAKGAQRRAIALARARQESRVARGSLRVSALGARRRTARD